MKMSAGMFKIISSVGHSKFISSSVAWSPQRGNFLSVNFGCIFASSSHKDIVFILLKDLLMTASNSYFCFSSSALISSFISPAYLLIISKFSAQCASSCLISSSNRSLSIYKHLRYSASPLISNPVGLSTLYTFALIVAITISTFS